MIVLLDTTVFSADTLCAKAAWKALALAAPGWGIRVAVTEVVVAEAAANYQRRIETLRSELKVWVEKKNAEDQGLIRAFEAAQIVLSAESAEYAGHLNENLQGIKRRNLARCPDSAYGTSC